MGKQLTDKNNQLAAPSPADTKQSGSAARSETGGYFTIREAAELVGVSPATLRNWEKNGLIQSRRRGNNYRVFDWNDVQALQRIRAYSVEAGLSQDAIRGLMGRTGQAEAASDREERKDRTEIDSSVHTALSSETSLVSPESRLLREYREQAGLTLDDAARSVDISPSYLSRIEQGKTNASFDVLSRLARFYGESPLRFFRPNESKGSALVRAGEGAILNSGLSGVGIESLLESPLAPFQAARFTVSPGCGDNRSHAHRSGFEFLLLLCGQLSVTLDETTTWQLGPQDSLHFASSRPHAWHNPGPEEAVLLWVHSYL